jgi:Flp pilus assembly pilin Flp
MFPEVQALTVLTGWLRAQLRARQALRDEAGFTAVEWLLIALGVIAIAGIAIAAVQAYVTAQTNKLSSP